MDITRWLTPKSDWLYSSQPKMEFYTVSKKQDWELTVAQITNSLLPNSDLNWRKWRKITGPFRYDLNQIPYDFTAEVRNRFKGQDLIDRVPDELWMEVPNIVQETGIKTIPIEKKCKKAKCLSEEALQIAEKDGKRKAKEKRKDIPIWMQSSKE